MTLTEFVHDISASHLSNVQFSCNTILIVFFLLLSGTPMGMVIPSHLPASVFVPGFLNRELAEQRQPYVMLIIVFHTSEFILRNNISKVQFF